MGSNQNETLHAARASNQTIASPRRVDELRRVAEIVRDIEVLGTRLANSQPTAMPGASEEVFLRATKSQTFSAVSQQGNSAAKEDATTSRRVWRPSRGAVIIVLFLVSSWAVVLMGPQHAYRSAVPEMQRLISLVTDPMNAIAQNAYRNAVAKLQRFRIRENAKVAGPTGTDEKVQVQRADRPPAKEEASAEITDRETTDAKHTAVAEVPRHEENAQTTPMERDKVEAELEITEPQTPTTPEVASNGQTVQDDRPGKNTAAREVAEVKPMSDSEVRQQAQKAEADLKLSEQSRKQVQVALNSLGYNFPTITGFFGPRTRMMIKAWQKAQGLPETGYLTEAQLSTLRKQVAGGLARSD